MDLVLIKIINKKTVIPKKRFIESELFIAEKKLRNHESKLHLRINELARNVASYFDIFLWDYHTSIS